MDELFANLEKFEEALKWRYILRERAWSSLFIVGGTFTFINNVYALSRAFKQRSKLWIPCFGLAAAGYCVYEYSINRLARTLESRTPTFKFGQLLFGPTLIGIATFYLKIIQKHDGNLPFYLPMVASVLAAYCISFNGTRRVEDSKEPKWKLFKGMELLVAGCLMCINGATLVAYGVNQKSNLFIIAFYTIMIFDGLWDISNSLEILAEVIELERSVHNFICGVLYGPVIFVLGLLSMKYVVHPIMLPIFIVTAGVGFEILGSSILDLYERVPLPVFARYSQRVLGPLLTVYSLMASAYSGYSMGWRFSVVMMPFIPIGLYYSYRGWQ